MAWTHDVLGSERVSTCWIVRRQWWKRLWQSNLGLLFQSSHKAVSLASVSCPWATTLRCLARILDNMILRIVRQCLPWAKFWYSCKRTRMTTMRATLVDHHLRDYTVIDDPPFLVCEHCQRSWSILDALNITDHQLLQELHCILALQNKAAYSPSRILIPGSNKFLRKDDKIKRLHHRNIILINNETCCSVRVHNALMRTCFCFQLCPLLFDMQGLFLGLGMRLTKVYACLWNHYQP